MNCSGQRFEKKIMFKFLCISDCKDVKYKTAQLKTPKIHLIKKKSSLKYPTKLFQNKLKEK